MIEADKNRTSGNSRQFRLAVFSWLKYMFLEPHLGLGQNRNSRNQSAFYLKFIRQTIRDIAPFPTKFESSLAKARKISEKFDHKKVFSTLKFKFFGNLSR